MKHLLNSLSEEEKNSIREQHSGKFKSFMNSKLGNVIPLNEQSESRKKEIESQIRELQKELESLNSGSGKRIYDKMVIDCLVKDGFRKAEQSKYEVYLVKNKGSKKLVVTSQDDPAKFYMSLESEGRVIGYNYPITPSTVCNDIVSSANNPKPYMPLYKR
jgi:hypothetical protein